MLQRIIRYLRGYITFDAAEGFTDLFMNACRESKTMLHDVDTTPGNITAGIYRNAYQNVLIAAQKSGMALNNVKKTGLPFLIEKHKSRIGIPVGMLLAAFIFLTLSSVVWSVSVTGLGRIDENDFAAYLQKNRIITGRFIADYDCTEIERIAEGYGENVLRVTANLIGCRLYIHVEERDLPPEMADNRYSNIIASKDGEVLSADVFAGEKKVSAGDAVIKGDMLVGGVVTLNGGGVRYVDAQARVIARTKTVISCQTAERIRVGRIINCIDNYALSFFGLVLPKTKSAVSSAEYLSADAGVFPVGFLRCRTTEFSEEVVELSSRASFMIALTDLAVTVSENLKGIKITECELSVQEGMQVCVDAQFICEEDIAKTQYFEVFSNNN